MSQRGHSTAFASNARTRTAMAALAVVALGVLALLLLTNRAESAAGPDASHQTTFTAASANGKPTVVVVHGAWADGTSWAGVITRLQRDRYTVIAPANPLRGLTSDAAYIRGVLSQIHGPIILAAHSYGGAVISSAAAGLPNVKALVYVDAFVPNVGEKVFDLAGTQSVIPSIIEFRGYPPFGSNDVEAYIQADRFHKAFAAD